MRHRYFYCHKLCPLKHYIQSKKLILEISKPGVIKDGFINTKKIKITGSMTECHDKSHRITSAILLPKTFDLIVVISVPEKSNWGAFYLKIFKSQRKTKECSRLKDYEEYKNWVQSMDQKVILLL